MGKHIRPQEIPGAKDPGWEAISAPGDATPETGVAAGKVLGLTQKEVEALLAMDSRKEIIAVLTGRLESQLARTLQQPKTRVRLSALMAFSAYVSSSIEAGTFDPADFEV